MPTNVYFDTGTKPEQHLYEDLMIEQLKIYGQDVFYIPRTLVKEDKAKVNEDRVAYRKHMKEHAKVLDKFVMETLAKEIDELRNDRNAQDQNMTKLEGFVMEQLTKELNEFHEDKRSLVEAKVKMIKEGKEVINQTKQDFIKTAAKKVEGIMENTIKSELNTLREDIKTAKENNLYTD